MNTITTEIPIANPGFELPFLGDNEFTVQDVPGWQIYDPSGLILIPFVSNYAVLNPATYSYPGQAPQGNNVGAIFLGLDPGSGEVALTQTLSSVLEANTTYNLQVKVGNAAPDEFTPFGFPGYRVELLAGDRVIGQDNNTQNPIEGSFGISTVKYTAAANDPNLGQPLQIRLFNILQGTGAEVGFDDVKLEATKTTIVNAGFEDPPLVKGGEVSYLVIPGWEIYDPSGVIDPNEGSGPAVFNPAPIFYPNGVSEGNNGGGLFNTKGPGSGILGITQKLPLTLEANTVYNLKFDVGNIAPSPDFSALAGFPGYTVQLMAGDRVIAQDYDTVSPPEGVFLPSSLTYSAAANDPNLGKQLELRVLNLSLAEGQEVSFDNFRLDITGLPKGLFNEAYYLQNNTDVAVAVSSGKFSSGFAHFGAFGLKEGRTSISPYFNEAAYLQTYSDVADAVSIGVFSSGLQHFIDFGYEEQRYSPMSAGQMGNAQDAYLQRYTDVAQAVAAGTFISGYDHYLQSGAAEGRIF
ncbi:hypothetical protein [Aerosakkonema funiforme]|uniref:hypothetical protein n=1 Tax=Aerosakkonema funiforme TaxID=1246630 RepID=UPI0035BA4562